MDKHDSINPKSRLLTQHIRKFAKCPGFEAKDPISSVGLPVTHNLMNHHPKTQYWASNGLLESKMEGQFYWMFNWHGLNCSPSQTWWRGEVVNFMTTLLQLFRKTAKTSVIYCEKFPPMLSLFRALLLKVSFFVAALLEDSFKI